MYLFVVGILGGSPVVGWVVFVFVWGGWWGGGGGGGGGGDQDMLKEKLLSWNCAVVAMTIAASCCKGVECVLM